MPEISPRVMNMVRRRILEDPTVTNDVLFAAAIEIEPDMRNLNLRQFNARYPLRVRRWELSERTKILQPKGPLSRAATFAAEGVDRQPRESVGRNGPSEPELFPGMEATPLQVLKSDVVPPRAEPAPLALVPEEPEVTPPDVAAEEERPVRRRRRRAPQPVGEEAKAEVILALIQWTAAVGQAKSIPEVFGVLATVDQYVTRIADVLELD